MITYSKEYVAGWMDGTINDFTKVLSPRFSSTQFALITCLDSNTDPYSLLQKSPELEFLLPKAKQIGNGILLPTETLLESNPKQVFFEFDEVWFFPTPDITPKPDSTSLVGPRRITQEQINALGAWMKANSCSLGLGDGEGLNFIIKAQGLIRYLLAFSMTQPVPTAQNTYETEQISFEEWMDQVEQDGLTPK